MVFLMMEHPLRKNAGKIYKVPFRALFLFYEHNKIEISEKRGIMLVIVIRTAILFALVVYCVRIMGKRQIGEMQASELVVTLIMSNVATIPMQNVETSLLTGVLPILTLVLLELGLSYLMLKSVKIKHFVSGRPVVVIANGKVDQKAMRNIRFSNEDLVEELRKNGVFDINSVQYAVIETDGVLSVLEKRKKTPSAAEELYALIINDGQIEKNSMNLVAWNEREIHNVLKKEKISIKDVYMMVAAKDKSYNVVRKER